jgi:hypothetical protein
LPVTLNLFCHPEWSRRVNLNLNLNLNLFVTLSGVEGSTLTLPQPDHANKVTTEQK